jgi:competence protein ComEC
MSRPMLGVSALVALGAAVGGGQTPGEAVLIAGLSLVLLLLALWASLAAAMAGLAAAAFGLGVSVRAWEDIAYERTPLRAFVAVSPAPQLVHLEGAAAEDAVVREEQLVLLLDVISARAGGRPVDLTGRVRVRVGGEAPPPRILAGEVIALWVELRAPLGYGNPGALDPAALLRSAGVHASGSCKSAHLLEVRGRVPMPLWRRAPIAARRWARDALVRVLPEGPERGIVVAMTLGDQTLIDRATAEAFRVAGTYHVLALSGAQVALIAGGMVLVLRRAGLRPWVQAAVLTPVLGFYALLVGAEVPIVRATFMALVALWGRACDLDVDIANLLGFTAAVLLLLRPSAIGDVGFELSFAATLGLLLLTPVLVAPLPRLPIRLELQLAASLAGQLALWPLLAARFHRLAPAALLLNLVAVPLSGLVLLAGLAVLAAAVVSESLAGALAPLAWTCARLLRLSSDVAHHWPAVDVRAPAAGPLMLLVYLGGLAALLLPGRRGRGAVLIAIALVGMSFPPHPADGRLHVTLIDVGQGDALVLRSPAGRAWAVDAGGSVGFDVGEAVLGPYLWSVPIRRLEGLAVSHAHVDHVGGAPFLLRHFAPRELWEGPAPRADPAYRVFSAAAAQSGARRRTVRPGLGIDLDGVQVEVVAPAAPRSPSLRTRNDDSLVLRVSFGDVAFLLTGDVEAAGESAILDPASTVLKVPHHGSRTSSSEAFLDRAGPRIALLSVGARNRFGHPNADVVRRFAKRGVRLYRTDQDGAVTVSTDGRTVWVSTFRSGFRESFPVRRKGR